MSEFECFNGHPMLPSQGPWCKICGMPVSKMDGKSNKQLRKEEEAEDLYDLDSNVPEDRLAFACERGSAVHKRKAEKRN